jgi:cobalt-zinc-cadmium efflux system outer membrane protein
MRASLLAVLVAGLSLPAMAQTYQNYPDLPPLFEVRKALENTPMVRAARTSIGVASADSDRLRAGSYETNVRVDTMQRRVNVPSGQFFEWGVGLERSLRLPGKSRIDGELGDQGMAQARVIYGDALHESGRMLLKSWFVWLRDFNQEKQWQTQVGLLRDQLAVVEKRIKAGDAARLEQLQAQAVLSQAEAQLAQAHMHATIAANELTQRYPGIALPAAPVLPEPVSVSQGLDYWMQLVLSDNHELSMARDETERSRLMLARSEADRVPDPAVGIRYGSERGGEERLIGVNLTIPLPGAGRAASQAKALASSEVAAEREAGVLTKVRTETTSSWLTTQSAYQVWQAAEQAATAIRNNADLIARAYSLGESGLSDVLTARRLMQEAQLAAISARLDVAEARYRLLLDTHQLWPIDADEAGHEPVVH